MVEEAVLAHTGFDVKQVVAEDAARWHSFIVSAFHPLRTLV
jgi:hypothetical protein